MPEIQTELAGDAHAYAHSKAPWLIDPDLISDEAETEDEASPAGGAKLGRRLVRYLCGGGMRAFGRTVEQEEADARRVRFLVAASALGVAWLWLWIA